jgi:hypothetical protein
MMAGVSVVHSSVSAGSSTQTKKGRDRSRPSALILLFLTYVLLQHAVDVEIGIRARGLARAALHLD